MQIKLNLKGNYKLVQEGERVLEITSAKVSPSGAPNKLTLQMKDVEDGASLQNTYNFNNDISVWAMGMMLSSEYNDKTFANVKKVIEKVEDLVPGKVEDTPVTEEEISYPDMSLLNGRKKIVEDDLD